MEDITPNPPQDLEAKRAEAIAKMQGALTAHQAASQSDLPPHMRDPRMMAAMNKAISNGMAKSSQQVEVNAEAQDKAIEFYRNLPDLEKDEFLIDIQLNGEDVLVCVRELSWEEAVMIEGTSFKQNATGSTYYSTEAETKEVLRTAIKWVAEASTERVMWNKDGRILARLLYVPVNTLWDRYRAKVYVSDTEASLIYESGKAYFSGASTAGRAIHPKVLMVDAMRKGIMSLSYQEFKAMTMSDYERLNLAWLAMSDALRAGTVAKSADGGNQPATPAHNPYSSMPIEEMPTNMFPPHMIGKVGPNGPPQSGLGHM